MTTTVLLALVPKAFKQLVWFILCSNGQGAKERVNMRTLTFAKLGENSLDKTGMIESVSKFLLNETISNGA